MVWIAATGTTVILGYILYRYCLVPYATEKALLPSIPETHKDFRDIPVQENKGLDARLKSEAPRMEMAGEDVVRQNEQETSKPAQPIERDAYIRKELGKLGNPLPSVALQDTRSSSPPRLKPATITSKPPRPNNVAPLRPPPSAASTLRVPPTKVLSNSSMAPSSLMPPPKKPSRKVMLEPGHSTMDWAMLASNPNHKLRGNNMPNQLIRVTPSMLKYHSGRKGKDAWTTYQGKVYNITPYLKFHPGGVDEIMKGAGRDSAKLFLEVHPWVNWEGMLGECLVGILVAEQEQQDDGKSGGLDEMD